jgi:hypothetical protein
MFYAEIIQYVLIPSVKNITITYINKLDKNRDGKITKTEIKNFWDDRNKGPGIKPQQKTIIKYIIQPFFISGGTSEIPKNEFIHKLKESHSPNLKTTNIEQGISIRYCLNKVGFYR